MGLFDFFKKRETNTATNADKLKQTAPTSVYIPEEKPEGREFTLDGKPGFGVFNVNAMQLEPKQIFGWCLQLIMLPKEEPESGVIEEKEYIDMQDYCDKLSNILVDNPEHTNSIFVARITHSAHIECYWYVNNPELANSSLQKIISEKRSPFPFQYEMVRDAEWNKAQFWLK